MDTLSKQWDRIKQGLLNSGVEIANAWMPTLTKLAKGVADVLEKFQRLPEPAKKFVGLAAVVTAAIGPLAILAGTLLKVSKSIKAVSKFIGGSKLVPKAGRSVSKLFGAKATGKALGETAEKTLPEVGSRVAKFAGKGKFLSGIKSVAGKIPFLDMAVAGSNLIGINKKNAGSKVGRAGGMLAGMEGGAAAGAAIGSIIPGAGTAVGGLLGLAGGALGGMFGGDLGSKIGKKIQKALPKVKKSISSLFTNIGKAASKAGNNIGKWFGGISKSINKAVIKPVKKAFKGFAKVISYPFVTAVGLVRMAWDKMKKPINSFASWIGKKLKAMGGKTISKVWNTITKPIAKAWSAVWSSVKKAWNGFSSWIGKKWSSFVGMTTKLWNAITKPIKNVWHSVSSYIKETWSGISSWLGKSWDSISGVASKAFNAVKNAIVKPIKDAWDSVKGIFDKIGNAVGNILDGVKGFTGKVTSKVGKFFGKAHEAGEETLKGHADGGPINRTHVAMVNEAGTEMAYDPRKGRFRLLGNGPTLAKVHAGEHILNAKDTAKVLSGGLGKGRTLPGYAKGTGKLKVAAVQSSVSLKGSGLDGSARSAKKSMRLITSTITNGYKKSNKNGSKELNQLNSKSTKIFGSLKVGTKKQTQQIQRNTIRDFNDMQKGSVTQVKQLNKGMNSVTSDIVKDSDRNVGKLHKNTVKDFDQMQKSSIVQMNQMHKGMNAVANAMVNDFYKIFGRLDNYAHKAMAAAIKQLNGGISGINTVLNKFGGGGSVLPLIHYAQGSKGPISKHTMAVVNDAKVGPRQEAIVKPNGRVFMPQGNDVVLPLGPGDEVLNGSETAKLQDVGGALPHFAKGTGGLKRLIQKNNKDPKTAWKNDFTSKAQGKVSTFLAGALSKTSKGASNKVGLPWNTEVWSQLNDALSGGGAGGNWLNSPGSGWSTGSAGQTFGSNGGRGFAHDGVDFGAALGTPFRAMHGGTVTKTGHTGWGGGALGNVITIKSDDGWQEIYQEFGSSKNIKVSVGDVVKPGQVIGTLGALQGAGSGAHLHVGVSHGSLWDHGGTSTRGWYDITKMHGKSSGTTKDNKKTKNPALTKLVKKELGNRIKWVTDKLGDDGDLGTIGAGPANAKDLVKLIRKAAEEMHATIPGGNYMKYLLAMIKNESGGRAGITGINDGDGTGAAMGLLQYKKSTFGAYAVKGHHNILSAWDQMLAFFNNSHYKTDIGIGYNGKWGGEWRGNASGPSGHRRFANGGWAENGKVNVFGEVPGQNEVAINTSRPSADKLIMEAMSDRASKQPNGIFGQLKEFAKIQNEFKKMKLSRDDFNESVKANSVGQKAVSIKPNMNYHPEIHIEGASDPERIGDVVAKQLTEDQRKFESMANNLFSKILAAQN